MNDIEQVRRCLRISLPISILVIFIGGALLRDAGENAQQAFGVASIFFALAVFHGLDEWTKYRRKRDQ
jgi:uncharacterized membrane protein